MSKSMNKITPEVRRVFDASFKVYGVRKVWLHILSRMASGIPGAVQSDKV